MARTTWKKVERLAAALFGAKRFWSNAGERLDFEADLVVGQVKNVRTCSLASIERLALEMDTYAATLNRARLLSPEARAVAAGVGFTTPKIGGVVVVKRSAGAGRKTPLLVCMTGETWARIVPHIHIPPGTGADSGLIAPPGSVATLAELLPPLHRRGPRLPQGPR